MNHIRRRIDEELSDLTFNSIPECRRKALTTTGKDKKMKLNKKALAICIAATAAVGCAVTAGAVTGWDYSKLIYGFFPETDGADITVQADVLSGTLQTIDAQKITNTFENYDVSFDGALFDGTMLMVSATVKNKDGSPFEDSEYDFEHIRFPKGTKGGTGGCELNDDGSLRLYFTMMYDDVEKYPTAAYTFEGLCRYPDVPELSELLDCGSFTVEFDVEDRCETRSFMLTDHDGNMVEAQLSPISVKLIMPKSIPENELYKYKQITIMGENGVILSPQDVVLGCGSLDPNTGIENHIMCFSRPLDINAVTAISGAAYITE
ncbi:MAG: hypothetical protein ACI4KA_10550 [Oscillospiraceae bacterium]